MKRNTKRKNEGITLIALVITIVVLLILAGVTIATLTGNNGILTKANEAKNEVEEANQEEELKLAKIELQMNTDKNELTLSNGNSLFKDKNGDFAIIPKGFIVSKFEDEMIIENGLVIYQINDNENLEWTEESKQKMQEEYNQFVWIPVDNPNTMYGIDKNGKKWGKLYNAIDINEPNNWIETNDLINITLIDGDGSFREPDIVLGKDFDQEILSEMNNILEKSYKNEKDFKKDLEEDFTDRIKSIKIYNGFYVGRYETSSEGATSTSQGTGFLVQSKKNVRSSTADNNSTYKWYGLYATQKLYNTNSIQGSMIYGCQYDQVMKWLKSSGIEIESSIPHVGTARNETRITGNQSFNDKLNNIYDLYGCNYEWTIEAVNNDSRVRRGGYFGYADSPSTRNGNNPYSTHDFYSSRLSLYIK